MYAHDDCSPDTAERIDTDRARGCQRPMPVRSFFLCISSKQIISRSSFRLPRDLNRWIIRPRISIEVSSAIDYFLDNLSVITEVPDPNEYFYFQFATHFSAKHSKQENLEHTKTILYLLSEMERKTNENTNKPSPGSITNTFWQSGDQRQLILLSLHLWLIPDNAITTVIWK